MSSYEPRLKRASWGLRRLRDRLAREGTPFVQLPESENNMWGPRYVADTRLGKILLEYEGIGWVLSLAVPGATHYARNEDWNEYIYGKAWGGYTRSEMSDVGWINYLLRKGLPPVDAAALDEIVERRRAKDPISLPWLAFWFFGSLVIIVIMYGVGFYLRSGTVLGLTSGLLALWLGAFCMMVGIGVRLARLSRRRSRQRGREE